MGWHRRGRGGEGDSAPVELRFVDMFMAAIGALIFMAMLLAWVMRTLGAKEAESKAGIPELQVLAYVASVDTNLLDERFLGRIEIEVNVQVDDGPTNAFSNRMPRPANSFPPGHFHPVELLDLSDTNAPSRFVFSGNSLERSLELKEVPFALLTMRNPKPGKYSIEYFIRPLNPTDSSINSADVLNSVAARIQVDMIARYAKSGTVGEVASNSLPVKRTWDSNPDKADASFKFNFGPSGTLDQFNP